MKAVKPKAQELQPGLEVAKTADLSPQEAKQAEKLERRKLYPVPPDAAANFRPAVGKELVEHALQASAAKRAIQGQQEKPCSAESRVADSPEAERLDIAPQDRRISFEGESNPVKNSAQGNKTSNSTTSLQLGSSRDALRTPVAKKAASADNLAAKNAPAEAQDKPAESAKETQSPTETTGKSSARPEAVSRLQGNDKQLKDEGESLSLESEAAAAPAEEPAKAVAEQKHVEQPSEGRRNSSEGSETSATPTPEQRRETALKVGDTCTLRSTYGYNCAAAICLTQFVLGGMCFQRSSNRFRTVPPHEGPF